MIVNSGLTLALVIGMSVVDTSHHAMANLGWERIQIPNPVFVGDTLYAESQVLGKRLSKSRPYAGIVRFRTRGLNQDGVTVLVFERSAMIYLRGQSPHDDTFPEPDSPLDRWEAGQFRDSPGDPGPTDV